MSLSNLSPRAADPEAVAFWWRAAWLGLALAGATLVVAVGGVGARLAGTALLLGAAPAGLEMLSRRLRRGEGLDWLYWSVGVGAAVMATGGLLGPLGAWALAPMIAAAFSRRTGAIARGGAASLAVFGLGLLVSLLGQKPVFDQAVRDLTAATGLTLLVAGAAIGLVLQQRRADQRERRLQADARRVARALEDLPALVLDLTPDGKIAAAYGRPAAGQVLAGRPLSSLAAPASRQELALALSTALRDGHAQLTLAPADNPEGVAEVRLRRGSGLRIAAVVVDAARQRDREAELEAARAEAEQQNAGKSRFLANMSHELRTPLNAIMGFSDIMRSGLFGPMPDRYGEYAELIHESGRHLLELINDVLDMSKIEADRYELSREEFDAREAVNAVLRLMRGQADRAGVQLRGVLPKAPLDIDADRRALKQIALNLVSNALKFTPRNGAVTVGLQAAGGQMELVVADTGMGMSAEDLARVGRPYEQAGDAERRAAGTGLGLSLVRSFAHLHGGEMFIESVVGEGTTVTVRMPVLLPEAPAPEPSPTEQNALSGPPAE